MSGPSPQSDPRPHPLAAQLCERLRPGAVVLELGTGHGRNTAALSRAGMRVLEIGDADLRRFAAEAENADAVLSTHGFLHGTIAQIARLFDEAAASLRIGGPLYATFASTRDARFGQGTKIAEFTYAPESGDEIGVAHAYFDEQTLRALLERRFSIEELREHSVDDVVGRWAHGERPSGSLHWFAHAVRKR